MYGAMYTYYQATRKNILTQTSSDSLGEALSEAMKKLSIKAKKQIKRKMERPRAASYSVDISRHWEESVRDDDEYSILGVEDNNEFIDDKEMNNNDVKRYNYGKQTIENEEYDSFKILRSMSTKIRKQARKEASYEEFF